MASALALDPAVQVQLLAWVIVLCSWARRFTLAVPFSNLGCEVVTLGEGARNSVGGKRESSPGGIEIPWGHLVEQKTN